MENIVIRPGRTEIDFLKTDKSIDFTVVHPFYGPKNSLNILNEIRNADLVEPTSREVAIFASALFKGDSPIEKEATKIMANNYFRTFTGIYYDVEEKVAYFIDHPKFNQDSIVDTNNLAKRLNESYTKVPFDNIKEGIVGWKDVPKNPYILAFAHGKEVAERLAELTSKHSSKELYIWVPDVKNLIKSEGRIAALGSGWCSYEFDVNGRGNDGGGYSFGVVPGTVGAKLAQKISRFINH